jgi:hypothetical protein
LGGGAEGQGFAVELCSSETFHERSEWTTGENPVGRVGSGGAGIRTLKSVRTPVTRTLRVLNVSALHASTFKTDLSCPSKSL